MGSDHAIGCRWERMTQAECEYRETHYYCPHPEHACDCQPVAPPATSGEACCGDRRDFGAVSHSCGLKAGHSGAHTSGSASWGAHEFTAHDARWPSLGGDFEFCVRCGVVKRADGKNKPCSGKAPHLSLRDQPSTPPDVALVARLRVHAAYLQRGGAFPIMAADIESAIAALSSRPQDELCDVCERPVGDATSACPHCHTRFACPRVEGE